MSRGNGKTIKIRIYADDLEWWQRYCSHNRCDSPDGMRLLKDRCRQKRQQLIYEQLGKPKLMATPLFKKKIRKTGDSKRVHHC